MCGHLAFGASLCLLGSRNQGDSKRPEQAAGWRAVMGLLGLLPLQLLFRGHPVGSGARAVSLKMRWSDSRVLTLAGWCVCVYMCVCVWVYVCIVRWRDSMFSEQRSYLAKGIKGQNPTALHEGPCYVRKEGAGFRDRGLPWFSAAGQGAVCVERPGVHEGWISVPILS